MSGARELNLAQAFHLHSAHLRCRTLPVDADPDRHPRRFRTYAGSHRVDLPGRDFALFTSLGEVLQRRRSVREYALEPLELEIVGRLLHASYGLRGYRDVEGQPTYDRPLPSAGGLYPLELYVAAQSVVGLPDGLYHYDPRAHQLELRQRGILQADLADSALGQHFVRQSNLMLVISAVFQRTMWKYGQRGYRYVWLDAGHLGQNLYLAATALGLGPLAIGGFFDDEINRLLALPVEEESIYLMCIGQPSKSSTGESTP